MKLISKLAAVLCATAIGGLSTQAMASPDQLGLAKKGVVGTWLASYDGGAHTGYIQWQSGGTLWDSMDFAPKIGNVLLGDWKVNADHSLSVYVVGFTYDDKGKTRTGRFIKTETDTVSGSTYTGTFEVTYYDLDGNTTFQHSGALTAQRVEPE